MKLFVLFAALTLIGIGRPYRADAAEEVPLIGCAIETAFDKAPALSPSWKTTGLPTEIAHELAFYATEGDNMPVLAPRGWQCHGTGGSSGTYLYIWPTGEPSDQLPPKGEFVSYSLTSNSGLHVLETLARERRLRNKHWTPQEDANLVSTFKYYGADFSFADCGTPFPANRLADRGPNIVEFETPPNQRGVGARGRL